VSANNKDEKVNELLGLVEEVLRYGVIVELYERNSRTLRCKVLTGPQGNEHVIARTINGIGFIGGKKKVMTFK
jgi:hypothetical protein